jgi:hypothetical protein
VKSEEELAVGPALYMKWYLFCPSICYHCCCASDVLPTVHFKILLSRDLTVHLYYWASDQIVTGDNDIGIGTIWGLCRVVRC